MLKIIVGCAIVGGIGYWVYIYASAEGRVRELCGQIRPGMKVSELRGFAEQHGMRKPTKDSGVDFVVEKKTFGRFGCTVTLGGGVVQSARYGFAS